MKMTIACATDDGVYFSSEHFGSARFYLLYSFDTDTNKFDFIKKIDNLTPEERTHGDPIKANAISTLLNGVDVFIAYVMGPNIKKIRKKFIPVISRKRVIGNALVKFSESLSQSASLELTNHTDGADFKVFYLT